MSAIAYTVIATLPDAAVASEYLSWLEQDHVERVLAAGASTAMIVRIEQPASPAQVETRYTFADRAAFEHYLVEAAPGLRAEGLEKFPPARGVAFDRRVGVVTWSRG